MRICYISPSEMPARSANSIHVARMCDAFNCLGHQVTLLTKSRLPSSQDLATELRQFYGVPLDATQLVSVPHFLAKAQTIQIALWAATHLALAPGPCDLILSRNLYAAFFLKHWIPDRLIFETHQLEYGFRKRLQAGLLRSRNVRTVVISDALKRELARHHGFRPAKVQVLPDAAPVGLEPISPGRKLDILDEIDGSGGLKHFDARVGYFGHLYPGRGIEIIAGLAGRHPDIAFLLFGGNEDDISRLRGDDYPANFIVQGHVAPSQSTRLMSAMDILLMPYQRNVSIGVRRHDTSRWMSPMKMFEYMAVGVPLIASDLPALGEVLRDGHNCLLAPPDDIDAWSRCVNRLRDNPDFAEKIASEAHRQYRKNYTWTGRAQRLIETAGL